MFYKRVYRIGINFIYIYIYTLTSTQTQVSKLRLLSITLNATPCSEQHRCAPIDAAENLNLKPSPSRSSPRHRATRTLHHSFPFSISTTPTITNPFLVQFSELSLSTAIAIILKLQNWKLMFPKLSWSALSSAIGQNSLSHNFSWFDPIFWLPSNWEVLLEFFKSQYY